MCGNLFRLYVIAICLYLNATLLPKMRLAHFVISAAMHGMALKAIKTFKFKPLQNFYLVGFALKVHHCLARLI